VFDHPLDACKPIAGVGVINWHDSVSVLPTATRKLYQIAQYGWTWWP
jgi:hypothetical protein